ncbi:MAG: hypothetical protein NC428_06225 [Clostridium sp.]|nr:hypothetical protein [Clostridium sp.]
MKKRKTYMFLIMTICIVLFSACGNKDSDVLNSNASFYDEGQEMALTMHELICDETYIQATGVPDDVREIIDKIGGMDYSASAHVYRVSKVDEVLSNAMLMGKVYPNGMSDSVEAVMKKKLVGNIAGQITARKTGTSALVVQSMFVVNTSFVNTAAKDMELYVYTYDDAYPVFVAFIPEGNGAVSASASYLIVDDMIGADSEAISGDVMISMYNIKLEEIKK